MLVVGFGLAQIEKNFKEVSDIDEPLSAAAYELEINMIGTALGVMKYLDVGDAIKGEGRERVANDEIDFNLHLAKYQKLAQTRQLRDLGNTVAGLYKEFNQLGKSMMQNGDKQAQLFNQIAQRSTDMDQFIHKQLMPEIQNQGSPLEKVSSALQLESNMAEVSGWLGHYLKTHQAEYRQKITDDMGDFNRHLNTFKRPTSSALEKQYAAQLAQQFNHTTALVMQVLKLDEQQAQNIKRFIHFRVEIDRLLDEHLQRVVRQNLEVAKVDTEQTVELVIEIIRILSPLFVLSVVVAAMVLTRRIRNPLRKIAIGAAAIGGGQLDYRLKLSGNNEFTDLAEEFNAMAATLEFTTVSKQKLELSETNLQRSVTELHHEIAMRRSMETELRDEKERLHVTLRSIGDAVVTTDTAGYVEYLNPIAEALTGWSNDAAQGMPLKKVFRIINEMTREEIDNPVNLVLEKGVIVGLANHTVLVRRDGQEFAIEDSAAPIREESGNIIGVVLVFHDVSAQRHISQQLSWQASHDSLTGLINRSEFEHRLTQVLSNARNLNNQHALLYLDMDQFKIVNDTCGHFAGDQLLIQLTALLQDKMRATDTLARLGGDEFGVLLLNCPLDQARLIAEQLRKTAQDFRFSWKDKTFNVGLSIGLVPITDNSQSMEQLMSSADAACYMAKDKGRNRIWLHHAGDAELAIRHGEMEWVTRINKAFEENRFCLYSQAISHLSGREEGDHFETLVRIIGEDDTLIMPAIFIPAAERYGLMPAIDRWVIKTTLDELDKMYAPGTGRTLRTCAINLSGASLNDEQMLAYIHTQLNQHQISPDNICFEVTETAAITNLTKARQFITSLNAVGCRFSLDDFGSGMSSFAYLKNLPVNYLKIDGGFVRDLLTNPVNHAMVAAINNIGHVMGIQTIAEFVENEPLLNEVTAMGIDYAQGYSVGKTRLLKSFV